MKRIKPFVGTWRITEMEVWGQDYVDMEVPGYIQIDRNGLGRFQFGLVHGEIDGRVEQCGNTSRFEFSWSATTKTILPAAGAGPPSTMASWRVGSICTWAMIPPSGLQGPRPVRFNSKHERPSESVPLGAGSRRLFLVLKAV